MLTRVDRYITRNANGAIAVVVLSLLILITLFALFEELDDSATSYGFAEAARYVLLTTPRRFDEILVYGLFIGYLIALGRFAETNELTVFRVSGMSPLRLCGSLLPSMLLWLIASVLVAEYVAPRTERVAEVDKLHARYGDEAVNLLGGLWLRDGRTFMQVQAIDGAGQIFGINQFVLNDKRQLENVFNAERGTYNEELQQWVFENGSRTRVTEAGTALTKFDRWVWSNPLTPDLLASQAFLEPNKMSMAALYRQIGFARAQSMGVSEYELAFWSRVLKPLTFFGLMLFALAVVLGPLREVGMGTRLTFGVFAGLGFKYLQDLFAPAAMVFNIPALIAILIPIAAYWGIAWYLIRRNA